MYTVNTTDVFEKRVKKVFKKYRRIQKDLAPFIEKNEYHRLLSKRFPFAIYYRIEKMKLEFMPSLIVGTIRPG